MQNGNLLKSSVLKVQVKTFFPITSITTVQKLHFRCEIFSYIGLERISSRFEINAASLAWGT